MRTDEMARSRKKEGISGTSADARTGVPEQLSLTKYLKSDQP